MVWLLAAQAQERALVPERAREQEQEQELEPVPEQEQERVLALVPERVQVYHRRMKSAIC